MKISQLFGALTLFAISSTAVLGADKAPDQFDFEPNPAIWQLSDEDTTIYIFGTIHALPKGLKWRTEKFNQIVNDVDGLVIETTDAEIENSEAETAMFNAMLNRTEMPPLMERVKPENQEALKELAEKMELPLAALDLMPTWMIPMLVYFKSIEDAEEAGEYGSVFGVETILEAEFAKLKKPVSSIEDGDAILEALNNLPDEEQLIMVDQMLKEWRKVDDSEESTNEETPKSDDTGKSQDTSYGLDHSDDIAWAQGRPEDSAVELFMKEMGDGFYNVLIKDRNAAWTIWLENRLKEPGKVLLAVGAGHLLGDDSLQKMLKAKGFEVERLQ